MHASTASARRHSAWKTSEICGAQLTPTKSGYKSVLEFDLDENDPVCVGRHRVGEPATWVIVRAEPSVVDTAVSVPPVTGTIT
jgi:hypothetical protein